MAFLPLVSIVIPVYKTRDYLRECISSCIEQTYKNIEVICIDDCSPDDSGAICEELSRLDSRLIVKHLEQNVGLSGARNAGLDIARGDYVFFLDSDDFLSLDAVERCVRILDKHPVDMILFNAEMFTPDRKFLALHGEPYDGLSGVALVAESSFLPCYVNAPFCVFSVHFLNKNNIRFYLGIFNEDWEFMGHCCSLANDVYVLNEALYHYRWSVFGSISTVVSPRILDIFFVLERVKVYYKRSKLWPIMEFAHLYRALRHLLWICNDKCDLISNYKITCKFIELSLIHI